MATNEFTVGEKVFAKVRGYPPWPARVDEVLSKGSRYRVFFYGTYETGTCKSDEVFRYEENLGKYGNPRKLKGFNQALLEIVQNPDLGLQVDDSTDTEQIEEPPQTEDVDESKLSASLPTANEPKQPPASIPDRRNSHETKSELSNKSTEKSKSQTEVSHPTSEKAAEPAPKKKKAPAKAALKPLPSHESKEVPTPPTSLPLAEGGAVSVPVSPKSVTQAPTENETRDHEAPPLPPPSKVPEHEPQNDGTEQTALGTPQVAHRLVAEFSEPGERVSRSGRKIKPKRFADDGEDLPLSPDRSHAESQSSAAVPKKRKIVTPKAAKEKEMAMGDNSKQSNDAAKENQPSEERATSADRGTSGADGSRIEEATPKGAKKAAKGNKEGKTPQSTKKSKAKEKGEAEGTESANPAKKVKLKEESLSETEEVKNQKEKVKLQWDPASAKALLNDEGDDSLSESVLAVKGQVETKVKYARMDKKKQLLIEKKKTEYKWLRVEGRLLQLDIKLKEALVVDHPHCEAAIEYLDEMYNLSAASLMLKKYPYIMDTIRKLKRYVGPKVSGDLTEEQKVIRKHAEVIRQKAEMVFQKFSLLFTTFDGQSFWDSFATHVENFKRATKHLSQEELLRLVREPALSSSGDLEGEEKEPEAGSSSQRH